MLLCMFEVLEIWDVLYSCPGSLIWSCKLSCFGSGGAGITVVCPGRLV